MAVDYAKERKQGRAPGAPAGEQSAIVDHPDVRRMLLTMRSSIEALRAVIYENAAAIDHATHGPDEAARAAGQDLAALPTTVAKGWGTGPGVELTCPLGTAHLWQKECPSGSISVVAGSTKKKTHH